MATTTMQLDTELRDQVAHIAQRDFGGATLSEALQRLVTEHKHQPDHAPVRTTAS